MSVDLSAVGAITVTGLNLMVPIALTAIGEIFSEKAGTVNIGLEGIILIGAWSAVFFSWQAHNAYIGILGGALLGTLMGAIHGYLAIWLKGDQIISGVGINIFALGFVPFAIQAVWGVQGQFSKYEGVAEIPTPWSPLSYFVPLTIVLAVAFWFVLNRTRYGSITKATGENPEAADAVGINVERVRMIAVLVGATLAGLSGAFLSVDYTGGITKDISAGRGFIALATVVFAGWNPLLGLAGGVLFGMAQEASGYATSIPQIGHSVPSVDYLFHILPYVITLVVVATAIGRSRFPKALGTPYRRE
ncbi:MAG: ABC transporter permease [Nitrososphaerales archaeon]|nr:ABC transporter permease [Nitrososphaerales archaeon]